MTLFWGFTAGMVAVGLEWLFRVTTRDWWELLWVVVPANLVISYGIFYLVRNSTSLLEALVTWTFSVVVARTLLVVFILRDPLTPGVIVGTGLIVLSKIVTTLWR